MDCINCRPVPPIEDIGVLWVRSSLSQKEDIRPMPYRSREQLLDMIEELSKDESKASSISLYIEAGSSPHTPDEKDWLPLPIWQSRLEHMDVVNIIQQKRFTSYMQPIVYADTLLPFGYEFLLRSAENSPSFNPAKLFEVAQQTGLHSFLDRAARISAIETGAQYLKQGLKRFVNFLPSSIYNPEYCLSHTFAAIDRLQQDPTDFVFEVVETERIDEVDRLQRIFEAYRSNGMSVALDDVGSGYSTIDVVRTLEPDYVKIDRSLIQHVDTRVDQQEAIASILEASAPFGAVVLAEGIEREEELETCRQLGVHLIQGYYIGRPSPHP